MTWLNNFIIFYPQIFLVLITMYVNTIAFPFRRNFRIPVGCILYARTGQYSVVVWHKTKQGLFTNYIHTLVILRVNIRNDNSSYHVWTLC